MNPQDLSSFDFKENPFADILSGMGSGQEQEMQQGPLQEGVAPESMSQAPAGSQPQMPVEGADGEMEDQLAKGQNPGNTKFLLGAVGQLENYIKQSTDREEIMTARGVIALLTRLIAKDQEGMIEQL